MRRELLLTLSGARSEVLEQCPSERIKFQSLGWAILITSGIAAVSMWFALYSAMGINPFAALVVAIAWGFVIMGIDRWLITSMPTEGKRRFAVAVPRLVLAVLLGSLISTPIVLRIFESEINAQITVIKQERASNFLQQQAHSQVAAQVTSWRKDVANLEQVIDSQGSAPIDPANDPVVQGLTKQKTAALAQQQTYYNQWQCQLYGGCGAPKGNGVLAQASQARYEAAVAQVANLTDQIQARENQLSATDATSQRSRLDQANAALPGAQQQLAIAVARQNALQANFDAQNEATNGLLIRLEALDQLSSNNTTVNAARILLFLLFLVIECLPVTVKLMQQSGNYEKILDAERARELAESRQAYRLSRRRGSPPSASQPRQSDVSDVMAIFERQATILPETRPQPSGFHDTDPISHRSPDFAHPTREEELQEPVRDEDLSISDRALRELREDRVSASSDGHGGGIPLSWDDDDL